MSRIDGIPDADAGWLIGRVYAAAKKMRGVVPDPLRLFAHSKPVMFAVAGFETAWGKARSVDPVLKDLCQLKVSAMVGCVF